MSTVAADVSEQQTNGWTEETSKTGGAGWFGKSMAALLALSIVVLKLYELGAEYGWTYQWAPPFIVGADWTTQWRASVIIVLEGLAAAAAITIAFGIFVSNSFTSNVSTRIVNRVKHAVNEETRENIQAIRKDVAESRQEVSDFRDLLHDRQADPEHLRLLERFLAYALDKRMADLRGQLEKDDVLFTKLSEAIAEAVQEWRKSRNAP